MPQSRNRPDGIPFHAAANLPAGNITAVRASIYTLTGYTVGQPVPSNDHNGKLQSIGFWLGYNDCSQLRNGDWLDTTAEHRLSATRLAYNVGDNATALPGAGVDTRASLLVRGVRVETDPVTLQTLVDPSNFPAAAEPLFVNGAIVPGRVWVYLRVPTSTSQPTGVRVESVGVGIADSPGVDEVTLRGVDIDILGLVTANVDPITAPLTRALPLVIPVEFKDVSTDTLTVNTQLDSNGDTNLGDNAGDLVTVVGTCTVAEILSLTTGVQGTGAAPVVLLEGATLAANKTIIGDTTTGITAGQMTSINFSEAGLGFQGIAGTIALLPLGARVATGNDLELVGTAKIAGVTSSVAELGTVELLSGAPVPTSRQLAADMNGKLIWHDTSGLNFAHYSVNGYVYATGEQITATIQAVTTDAASTTVPLIGIGLGNVRVIVEGQVQVNSLGSTLTISVREDQTASPLFTNIGASQVVTATHDTSDANDWQKFRHERTFASGITTATLYQVRITAQGGKQASVKETFLRVVPERS